MTREAIARFKVIALTEEVAKFLKAPDLPLQIYMQCAQWASEGVSYEHVLSCVKRAAINFGMTEQQIEDIEHDADLMMRDEKLFTQYLATKCGSAN